MEIDHQLLIVLIYAHTCEPETMISFEASADAADLLERGGNFEPLRCSK